MISCRPTSKVGLNPAVLDSLDAEIRAGKYGNIDRMVVIRRGQIVTDKTYPRDYDRIYGDSTIASGALLSATCSP